MKSKFHSFKPLIILWILVCFAGTTLAQKIVTVKPVEIDDVLTNPGMGFMTFQRFNGDELNPGIGWTEGFPIEYQDFDGNIEMEEHPFTSIAYFRLYWRFLEPEEGQYQWEHIDKALKTARERKQQLLIRVAPYGNDLPEQDVPDWFRGMAGDAYKDQSQVKHWQVNHEDPLYIKHFGNLIREMGKRYDGHPDLDAVDLSIIGAWGEGEYTSLLTETTMNALVDAYLESFKHTPLIMQLSDFQSNQYGLSKANVGWRVDCLGDLGIWAGEQDGFNHMHDKYPQNIIEFGMQDAWKKAPVSLEVCSTIKGWKEKLGYDLNDVRYIIDESLKWHISSFNNKSSGIPEEWWPEINRWLKKMGYRLVLRKITYPERVKPNEMLSFTTWWDNKGVAPCYKDYPLAFRLKKEKDTHVLITGADIRDWLPGDNLYNDAVFIPPDLSHGWYDLQIGIIDPLDSEPVIDLAIEGKDQEGWYTLGKILIYNE
ncbi:MAG: DUF4832 domain-containing protein [Bacteroidales bacterium]